MRSQISAVLLALVLVASPISMVAGPGVIGPASAQTGAPDGMVTIPDTNVVEDLPVGASSQLTRADLEGSVMASDNASSLQVIVTTPKRASGYVNGSRVSGSGDRALVFRDNSSHAGRDVAVPADAVRETVGHVPNVVHGVHEDGTSWTAQVEARNGLLIFHIPHFSSNSVTFSGEVSLQETPAVDGSKVTYDVTDSSRADEYDISLTGVDSTETETVSAAGLSDGDTFSLGVAGTDPATNAQVTFAGDGYNRWDNRSGSNLRNGDSVSLGVDGNLPPKGPSANDEPVVRMTGQSADLTAREFSSGGAGDFILFGTANSQKVRVETEFGVSEKTVLNSFTYDVRSSIGSDYNMDVDIYIDSGGVDNNHRSGTLVANNVEPSMGGTNTIQFDDPYIVESAGTYHIDIVTSNANGDNNWAAVEHDDSPSTTKSYDYSDSGESAYLDVSVNGAPATDPSVSIGGQTAASYSGALSKGQTAEYEFADLSTSDGSADLSANGGLTDVEVLYRERQGADSPGLDVDGDGTDEASHSGILLNGETSTKSLPNLDTTDDTATVSLTSGTVDAQVDMTEHTVTENPEVLVNGNETGYTGRLDPGQEASLTTDTAWIQDGTNNVTVAVGDGTLSSDAPTPAVDLNYTHTDSAVVSTTYTADGWQENYHVSHTFAGDRENAELRIPFSERIYRIPYVEIAVNGGTWQSVSSSNWELKNGTDLVVQLEDTDGTPNVVEAGDEVEIRTAGNKFQTTNGAISVTDPTTPDDEGLDTGFTVDSKSTGFRLEVGGTPLGDRVHYTHTESWEAPNERTVLSADGSQDLYLPNAQTGGSARVTTIPLEAQLDSGDVGIQVVDPDNPTLAVDPGESGSGATVQYRWHDAVPGEQYGLYSLPKERYVDKTDAGENYVQLADDDSQETLVIKQPDGSSGGGGGGGGSGGSDVASGVWDNGEDGIDLQQIAVIVGWAVFSLLLVAATGRSSLSGRPRWILVGTVSTGLGLLALEILRPGAVSGALNQGIQEIVPLAGLAGIGIAAYSVVQWWQTRREEATTPETQVVLGGNSD